MDNPTIRTILERRSARKYLPGPIGREVVEAILAAASRAPSGMNNQPWRFVLVEDAKKLDELAGYTKYGKIVRSAPLAIAVFMDNGVTYHREKDLQSIGACLQNILLSAQALGLGACWLGEILNKRAEVEQSLGVGANLELMAVVAIGKPDPADKSTMTDREPLDTLVVGRF